MGHAKENKPHPVELAKGMYLDAGGTKLGWCRMEYSERYQWIARADYRNLPTPSATGERGRPRVTFTARQLSEILRRAKAGQSVPAICREMKMPNRYTDHIYKMRQRWIASGDLARDARGAR